MTATCIDLRSTTHLQRSGSLMPWSICQAALNPERIFNYRGPDLSNFCLRKSSERAFFFGHKCTYVLFFLSFFLSKSDKSALMSYFDADYSLRNRTKVHLCPISMQIIPFEVGQKCTYVLLRCGLLYSKYNSYFDILRFQINFLSDCLFDFFSY